MCTKTIPVLWGCFLLWNLYVSSSQTIYPGIKARITQRALDYGVQAGMKMIEQMLKEKKLPDLSGSESLEFLKVDYVNYNFSNIKISAFSFPNTSLAFVPGVGIKALTNHGTANISTDWGFESPLFQDTGGADLFLSGVYFTGIIILTRNDFGHPTLKLQDCYAQLSHAHVSFSGELSVLYNSFAEPMEKPILKNLNEMLCPIIASEVKALNANLSTLEVLTKIDNYTLLDYSLISSPEITENYLDLNLKGVFYPLENLTDPPFSPVPFVLPERSNSMLYIGIAEYFFKSASFAHFTAGAFNVTLSTEEISNHFVQNSQGLGNVLSRVASTSVGLVILGQRLVCSLSLNRFRLALPESNRSNIEVLRFENILSSILHFGVLPLANAKLQQGFPLPNPHKISFINSDIEVLEGFLLISTDLKYETSSKQQPSFHGWEGLNLISGQWRGKSAP
ncbi:BPI fold-containing family C protein isoform X2 [Pan troglodytes]|uniref:BPI fold-containing family C protein isoform X2 n=1 Tax=Pan troglodytes TaxID=9598 RepID=UPI000511C5AC|nr:BPI fold-containing family C protein isoform X2 [Pan troglodytes]XP_054531500.1 BPI fold-containing family C protein isoform X2 [Pan troglodytes]